MNKLEKMLKYVSNNNEFYMNIISSYGISSPEQITQYPIITREMLQSDKNKLLSNEYFAHYLTNRLYKLSSSGTSGVPIETMWEPSQYGTSMLCLWRRRKKYYNISPKDKHIDFMLKYYNNMPDEKLKYTANNNTISVNRLNLSHTEVLAELFALMKRFQPVWLQLSPSVMEILINHCLTNNETIPQSIKYVEFMSEVLTPMIREQTKKLIPNAQIANMYGSEEMNAIAYECPCGKMHVISDNVFAECFDGKNIISDGEGEIILTNLHNQVSPLIRYSQGDKVVLNPHTHCACGYDDKIISSLYGRVSSTTKINGKNLSTCDISDIMLIVTNKYGHPIKKYKFIYDTGTNTMKCYTLFNHYLVNWKQEIWNMIKNFFVTKYGSINIEFIMDDYDKDKYKHDLLIVK